jgi:hypothetical protein
MKRFVVNTTSESGDHYTYLLQHPHDPSSKELDKFLLAHANDRYADQVYESVDSVVEINDGKFLTIPNIPD